MSNPLAEAIAKNDVQTTQKLFPEFLRDNGENLKNHGVTPAMLATHFLQFAAENDAPDTATFLISQGADVNGKDAQKGSYLHRALYYSSYQSARVLIENGADLTARNYEGDTPLHHAVYRSADTALITLMLEKGADPQAKNGENQTPLDIAENNNDPEPFLKVFKNHARAVEAKKEAQRLQQEQQAQQDRLAVEHQENLRLLGKTPVPPLKLKR